MVQRTHQTMNKDAVGGPTKPMSSPQPSLNMHVESDNMRLPCENTNLQNLGNSHMDALEIEVERVEETQDMHQSSEGRCMPIDNVIHMDTGQQ